MQATGKAKQLVDPQGGQEEEGGQEEQGALENVGYDHQWGPIDFEGLTQSLEQYRNLCYV